MFVPYADPSPTQYRKLVLDEGEYGIGLLTNALELGCDCLGEIATWTASSTTTTASRFMPNAICLHEEDHGIAWKHTNFRTGYVEVRRMRRMVISSIVTVGNYEYAYYWYLYQDGSIEYEVKLSGVISNGALPAGETSHKHGTVVAPRVYGPHHQHFFNVRLDMAVDGPSNRVYEVTPRALPEGPGQPGRQRLGRRGSPHRGRVAGGAASATRSRAGTGRSSTTASPTPSASRSPTSSCPSTPSRRSRTPAPPSPGGRASSPARCG